MRPSIAETVEKIYNDWDLHFPPFDKHDIIDALVEAYMAGATDMANDAEKLISERLESYSN